MKEDRTARMARARGLATATFVLSLVSFLAAIWTQDERWVGTAFVFLGGAFVSMLVALP